MTRATSDDWGEELLKGEGDGKGMFVVERGEGIWDGRVKSPEFSIYLRFCFRL